MIDFGAISTNTLPLNLSLDGNISTDSLRKNRLNPDNYENSYHVANKEKQAESTDTHDLNLEELRELTELKQRDIEVKAHEQAHIAAGGMYVRSGAHYEYEEGSDGRKYAVGGEVRIDTSKVPGNPEATIRKMQVVRSAALAPVEPSAQDRNVAAEATRIENQSRLEILTKRYTETAKQETGVSASESDASDAEFGARSPAASPGGQIDLVL